MSSSAWPPGPGVVTLPRGTAVRCRGLRRGRLDGPDPELGVYLLGRPPPPMSWEARWVRWPDLRLPTDPDGAVAALRVALAEADERRLEVACRGGRGRTGTALAVMAVADGVDPAEAVAWVRRHHHPRAVETRAQRRWVAGLDRR